MINLLEFSYKQEKILKQRMKLLRLSQADVAKQVKVSQAMVSGYISGKHPLNYDMAEKLGKILRMDPVTLWVTHALENREDLGEDLKSFSSMVALESIYHGLVRQAEKEVKKIGQPEP